MKRLFHICVCTILCVVACSTPPPDIPSPKYFPNPTGRLEVGAEAQEIIITIERDVDNSYSIVTSDLSTQTNTPVATWGTSLLEFSFPTSVESRWWSIDYTESCTIVVHIEHNSSGCLRTLDLQLSRAIEDHVVICQQPERYVDYQWNTTINGATHFATEYVNNSSHTVTIENITWLSNRGTAVEQVSLQPGSRFEAYRPNVYMEESQIVLNDDVKSLWCEPMTPLSCTVVFDDMYTMSHAFTAGRCGEYCLADWTNYELELKRQSVQVDSYPHKEVVDAYTYTLTYTFTDADYDNAVKQDTR